MNYNPLVLQKNYYLYLILFTYRLNALYLLCIKTSSKSSSVSLHRKWAHINTSTSFNVIPQSLTCKWDSKLYSLTTSVTISSKTLFITTININVNRQLSKFLILPSCNSLQVLIYRLWFLTQINYYDCRCYQNFITTIHFNGINFYLLQKTLKIIQQNITSTKHLNLTSFVHNIKFL